MASCRLASSPSAACRVSLSLVSASWRNCSLFCWRARVDRRANSPVSCWRVSSKASARWVGWPAARGRARRSAGPAPPGAAVSVLLLHRPAGPEPEDLGGQDPVLVQGVGQAGLRRPRRGDLVGPDQQAHHHAEGDAGDESHDESDDHDESSSGRAGSALGASVPRGCITPGGRPPAGPSRAKSVAEAESGLCHHGAVHRVVIVGAGFGGPLGRPGPGRRAGRGDHRRPAELPHLPAAALRGGHGRAGVRGTWPTRSGPSSVAAGNVTFRFATVTGVDWDRRLVTPGRRRSAALRLGHRGQRGHRQVLRDPRGLGVQLPPLHAERCPDAAGPHPAPAGGGRHRPPRPIPAGR